jgi:hypothetical protein
MKSSSTRGPTKPLRQSTTLPPPEWPVAPKADSHAGHREGRQHNEIAIKDG